ncbi:tyrosine-protein phosphatase (plasmid) [Komagataeibacter nataicola]|uniref:tyrosine-protein phosphatase n=1 Tax=Komagataeibacter nataicola TaxID=265960 RepID=UPI0023DD0E04|nr:tyrosine-protein phosphatase [Komagataeibacter nataicola]WEQ57572.1 tyrosine-protein phosphatase [Komagataeibacter nataicola]
MSIVGHPDTDPAISPFAPWRFISMEGTLNTRDIGGYPVAGGGKVVTRRIYRSANLAQITPADVEKLARLGIDTVIDFRGPKEAKSDPDRLPKGANYLNSPIIGNARGDDIDDTMIRAMLNRAGLPDTMLDQTAVRRHGPYYRMLFLVDSYGTAQHVERLSGYRPLFQTLLDMPATSNLLFHCTGGRDRTGVGVTLFLKAVGVSDEWTEAEFVASNRYLQPDRDNPDSVRFLDFASANVFLQPSVNKQFKAVAEAFHTTPDTLRGAVELKPLLLRRMFQAIDEHYGSFDAFLEQIMGIGTVERATLRHKYVD